MPKTKDSTTEEELGLGNGEAPPSDGEDAALADSTADDANGAGTGNGEQNNTPPDKKDEPGGEKKIGLVTFIQATEPNKYVVSILKNKRSMEAHTKQEWEQIVKNLLGQKVS